MAVVSRGKLSSWIEKRGRLIKIQMGDVQRVSICIPKNQDKEFEEVHYFSKKFHVTPEQVDRFYDIRAIKGFLRKRAYAQAKEI